MHRVMVASIALLLASTAQAIVLHDNGPAVNNDGKSIIPVGSNTFGWTTNSTARLADDFTVTGPGWSVESIDFFGYQTNASAFTFTSVIWSVVSGTDINAGTVVASGTDNVTNGGFIGYRVPPGNTSNTQRPIFRISADVADFNLAAGSYFLVWSLRGSLPSGPFSSPVEGSFGTGNALQSTNNSAFFGVRDGASNNTADLPFVINGSLAAAVPEPASWAMLLMGFGAIGASMRRRRSALASA